LNYKGLFNRVMMLLSSPAKAWEEISGEDRQLVMMEFVYPLIALAGLSVLIGVLVDVGWSTPENYQEAMTQCAGVAVSLFGGFYLSSYLVNLVGVKLAELKDRLSLAQQFTGYSLVVVLVLQIIYGLLPDFLILVVLLSFYTIYIVWEGADKLMHVEEQNRLRYTIVVSAILLVCPLLIQVVFNKLTVMLN